MTRQAEQVVTAMIIQARPFCHFMSNPLYQRANRVLRVNQLFEMTH